jgi:hypothetical protein
MNDNTGNKKCQDCNEIKNLLCFNRYPCGDLYKICKPCYKKYQELIQVKEKEFLNSKKQCCRCGKSRSREEFNYYKWESSSNHKKSQCRQCDINEEEYQWYQTELVKCGMRQCSGCEEFKTIDNFRDRPSRPNGKDYHCLDCRKENRRIHHINNKEKDLRINKKWREDNYEYYKKIRATSMRNRRRNDLSFRIKERLSCQLWAAINKGYKKQRTIDLLGCSIEFFIDYFKSKFTKGMNWNNYGRHSWDIEHRLPCELFDFTDERQQKICFHYTNLQPMKSSKNYKKSDLLPDGRSCRFMSPQEKLDYLRSLGHNL